MKAKRALCMLAAILLVVSGKIESWKDYDDGDQIQVKIDGTTYLVHSANIALIKE